MARIISNNAAASYDKKSANRWAYNALDVLLTHAVWQELRELLDQRQWAEEAYRAEMALQGPTMTCQFRGIRVDEDVANWFIDVLERAMRRTRNILDVYSADVQPWREWKRAKFKKVEHFGLNPNSPDQVAAFFYDCLGVEPVTDQDGKRLVDRGALEKIRDRRYDTALSGYDWIISEGDWATPTKKASAKSAPNRQKRYARIAHKAAKAILLGRDINKQLDAPKARRSQAGRFRFSMSVGATETFRLSSTKNPFQEGSNIQNIATPRKRMLVPDPGYFFVEVDLEQAESMILAFASGDEGYIQAHIDPEFDTHTYVCTLCWPEIDWPENNKEAKKLAQQPFYRGYSYRFMAKKIQHAIGRGGTYRTVAENLFLPASDAKAVVKRFEAGVPKLFDYMDWIADELKGRNEGQKGPNGRPAGQLKVPGFPFQRQFFDRVWDPQVARFALAFVAQAPVAWVCHIGFYRIWKHLDEKHTGTGIAPLELLSHNHDSTLTQVAAGYDHLIDEIAECMRVTVPVTDIEGITREMTIPVEVKTGWTWKDLA